MACPFCARIAASDVTTGNALAVAFLDAFPLTPGHTLVVPRPHEPDFLALSGEERQAAVARDDVEVGVWPPAGPTSAPRL